MKINFQKKSGFPGSRFWCRNSPKANCGQSPTPKFTTGFSLVEMIIYISLLAITFTAVVTMLVNMTVTYRALKVSKDIDLSAFTAMEWISNELKLADSVYVAQSNLATTTNPYLSLNSYSASGASTVIKFFLSGNTLRISEGGVDKGALTASTTKVTRLIFYSVSTTTTQAIKTEMWLSSGTTTNYKQEKFYITAVLRGSYKNR